MNMFGCNNCTWIWILILVFVCCGNGNNGAYNNDCGCGHNSCC